VDGEAQVNELKPRLRVLHGEEIALGPGKVALLEQIGQTGTVAEAARLLGMSYTRAWHRHAGAELLHQGAQPEAAARLPAHRSAGEPRHPEQADDAPPGVVLRLIS
jgi:hypothetical protein